MKFKFDPRAGRMVGSRTQILQRHEIERLGGVIPDNRHISPGTAYIPEKDVMQVKAAARRDGVEVIRLNDYDKDIGGGLYRFEKTTTFESRKHMKINENTKVTLTVEQIKKLVKEIDSWPKDSFHWRAWGGLTKEMWPEFEAVAKEIQDKEPEVRYTFLAKYGYEDWCPKEQMTFMEVLQFLFDQNALGWYIEDTVEDTVKNIHDRMNKGHNELEIVAKGYFARYDSEDAIEYRERDRKYKREGALKGLLRKLQQANWDNGGCASFLKLAMHDTGWSNDSIDEIKDQYKKYANGDFNAYGKVDLGSNISNGGYDEKALIARAEREAKAYEKDINAAAKGIEYEGKPISVTLVNKEFPIFTKADYSDDGDDSYSTVFLVRIDAGGEMLNEGKDNMKKLNENSKVALTMKQLKKLVKEGDEWSTPDSDFRCCWCGEPVDMDTAHNVGHDIYCDDCFRERFYHKKVNEGTIDADLCAYMKDEIALFLKKKYGTFQYNMRIGDSLKVEAKGSSIWISIAPNKYSWKTLLVLAESVLKERGMVVMDHHVWDGEKDDNGNPVVTLEVEVNSNEVEPVTEEFDTEDGWDCDEIRDSGLMDTLRKCANLHYTLDKCTRASANFGETLGDLKAYVNELAEDMMNAVAGFPDEEEFQGQDAMGDDEEIEVMERIGDTVSDADVRELVLYITNDSGLYHRWVEPIIANLRRKAKKGIYDSELAVKLWKHLADEGAKKYDKELNDGPGRVDWLNVPTRMAIAKELRDHYQERIDEPEEVTESIHKDSFSKKLAVKYADKLNKETGNPNFAIHVLCDSFGENEVANALLHEWEGMQEEVEDMPFESAKVNEDEKSRPCGVFIDDKLIRKFPSWEEAEAWLANWEDEMGDEAEIDYI